MPRVFVLWLLLGIASPTAVPVLETSDACPDCCGETEVRVGETCLPSQGVGSGCWVSAQCATPNSVCRRPSGRILSTLREDLWDAYVRANRSSRFVPGKCGCTDDFAIRATAEGEEAELICVARTIGAACRSNYECGKRSRFSACIDKKCACLSPHYLYERATDQCTPAVTQIACGNNSCPRLWFGGTFGELCFYGFSASMTLVLAFWLTFCFCSRLSASDYEAVPVVAQFPLEPPLQHLSYSDDPPSYESATTLATEVKRKHPADNEESLP